MSSMLFCSHCGARTVIRIPAGDQLPRVLCDACSTVHYQNPRVVVGCVPQADDGRILICRRAIEPRLGYWTVPAGFMENGESLEQGAARETHEEALAHVQIGSLLALISIPEAQQVHVFFRGRLLTPAHSAGPESLETRLVDADDIPWADIAFQSTIYALERFLEDRAAGRDTPHVTSLPRRLSSD
jgi:ADP-ribose pyrophosphatase YjhB (NUDIX family)